jgi:hypothetical protein
MEELLKTIAEHFGWTVPFMYAAGAYFFFHWLDEKASDEAKAALARTMRWKDYKNEQVASALVEVFDRIYTYPLLRWRAFFRSLLFTTVVTAIFLYELYRYGVLQPRAWGTLLLILLLNVFTDYLSLFAIRPLLIRSGTRPVIGLVRGAVSATAIVLGAHCLRVLALVLNGNVRIYPPSDFFIYLYIAVFEWPQLRWFILPALAVFVWLPLFALGIVIARLLTPLSWIVGRTQWFLKEGKEHPLKAIGYVAAVVVCIGTVAGRAIFSAWI